ncbi:hypothetical protein P691DRAFT_795557 [Macrolepiota fuliginosa MF-IS2]|uniref:Pyrroloquinoline quinone-dependent pyranose dehydrogenase beta-propeller domain-containing protein n=1 Tax=Macrolepiota fuliginosa MF-IS2 TaxID=1400762 RepID=A0A9P5X8S9_9AGAR|nr:hypothetical protein P691DRAFT_795557 [Macrolepiota fuliginosa MF-IS2]
MVLAQSFQPDGVSFATPVTVASGLSASVIFSNLTSPRGITIDSRGNLLVVESGVGISVFSQAISSSVPGWTRTLVVENKDVTHGIQFDGSTLYVSTASDVLLYSYDPTTKTVTGGGASLITGLPADGELTTHTIEFDRSQSGLVIGLLVGTGPKTNIDETARNPASGRSQIRHFSLQTAQPFLLKWDAGTVVAYGIRNPAGFTFSDAATANPVFTKTLLIVENAASIDNVTKLTSAFANDNPADEIESLEFTSGVTSPTPFYGFPDCATLWNPDADPVGVPQYTKLARGAQFSLNLPGETPLRDDAWCQNTTNNLPPAFNFQAHSVPLDIKQYIPGIPSGTGDLPSAWANDLFVSFHGSFNRSPPTGYGVVRVPHPFTTTIAVNDLGYSFLIQAADLSLCPGKCLRPVGLAFGKNNLLYATSDATGEVFVIQAARSTI